MQEKVLTWPEYFIKSDSITNDLLHKHNILGLYYATTQNSIYRQAWKEQWIHNEIKISELKHLTSIFQCHNITPVLLKGVDLIHRIYTDYGSRFLSDIDLLIPYHDFNTTKTILLKQGYVRLLEKKWFGNRNKAIFHKVINGCEVIIELHSHLFYHLDNIDIDLETSPIKGYKQLEINTLFVQLAGHYAFQHNFQKLYWLFDLYYLVYIYQDDLNFNKIKHISKLLKLEKSTHQVLWILKNFFNLSSIGDIQIGALEKRILTMNFLLNERQEGFSYFLLKHLNKDSLWQSFKYDFYWIKSKLFESKLD
jgi:hypothetical protein